MHVNIQVASAPGVVEQACAITAHREARDYLKQAQWKQAIQTEHSPLRCFMLWIKLEGIPYFSSVHLCRHKIGVEHFVRSQRSNPDRATAPQGSLVDHALFINAQAVLNISRRRLCYKADAVTRGIWEAVKLAAMSHPSPFVKALGEALLPMCYYQQRCPEVKSCGLWDRVNE